MHFLLSSNSDGEVLVLKDPVPHVLPSTSLRQASLHSIGTGLVRLPSAGECLSPSGAGFKLPGVYARCRVTPVLEISASMIRCARAVDGAAIDMFFGGEE